MITQKQLQKLFKYVDGELIRKVSTSNKVKVGDSAGTISKKDGYCYISVGNKLYKRSRLVWLYLNGELPEHKIDHINGRQSDDKIENLRDVTQADNRKNCRMMSNNTSGTQGVRLYKRTGKYMAFIGVNGKNVHLGYHKLFEDAVKARKEAETLYGFHENHGRTA